MFACRGRTVCLVGLSSNAAISASTDVTSWGTVQVVISAGGRPRPAARDHAFVGDWGLAVPHQYLAGCLWSSGRRQKGNIPMPGHTVLSGGSPRFDCRHCRFGFVAPLAATWAHVLGVESDVTIPPACLSRHT